MCLIRGIIDIQYVYSGMSCGDLGFISLLSQIIVKYETLNENYIFFIQIWICFIWNVKWFVWIMN